MKIAQVAPLFESVPPRLYGGTERVVSYLTDTLVRMGHDVTLFASGDSKTFARLRAPCAEALRLADYDFEPAVPHTLMMELVLQEAANFDFIHFHTDCIHFPLARRLKVPNLTTLHGRLDQPFSADLYAEYDDLALSSISVDQRTPLPNVHWAGTVYHGLPTEQFNFNREPEGYLAFLGRISKEKRVDRAIEIARKTNMKIKIAAKIDKRDVEYAKSIAHFLDEPHVEFIGEISEEEKSHFLGNAAAMLFPIDWPEPFGIVMIEALATGTPIIAFGNGSVPEIVRHGVTGFIVNSCDEACDAVKRIRDIRREDCRKDFEQRFSATRMAEGYIEIYRRLSEHRSIYMEQPEILSDSRYSGRLL